MRTVSFSDNRVQDVLNSQFVCCYTDTTGDPTAGASFRHAPSEPPGPCGRGAGRQNVQVIFLTPGSEVFHVAAGYLKPDDLLEEIEFARDLFDRLSRNRGDGKQAVIAAHQSRLRKLDFTVHEIASSDNLLTDMFLAGPNPQDLGIHVPGLQGVRIPGSSSNLFQDIDRQRILKDNQFSIRYPLVTRKEFERQPEVLVGRHKSFFGSNSAMNGIGDMFQQPAMLRERR